MNALTRFERLDDMFPEMFRRIMRPLPTAYEAPAEIRVDVTENDKAYEVRAEVPGAKKSDIHITVDGNYVSIATEVKRGVLKLTLPKLAEAASRTLNIQ